MTNIETTVQAIIAAHLVTPLSSVVPDSNFIGDLGADSLDVIEMVMEIEQTLNVILSDEDVAAVVTVRDLYRLLPPDPAEPIGSFISSFNELAQDIHATNVRNGFWEGERNKSEAIALMHSELSEALEGLRDGDPPDNKLPKFPSSAVEFADCIIRIMDYAAGHNLPVAESVIAKAAFNKTRPYKHGRKF